MLYVCLCLLKVCQDFLFVYKTKAMWWFLWNKFIQAVTWAYKPGTSSRLKHTYYFWLFNSDTLFISTRTTNLDY